MEQNEQPISYDERRRRAAVIQRERREAQVRKNLYILAGASAVIAMSVILLGTYAFTGKKDIGKRKAQPAHQAVAADHVQQTDGQQKVEKPSVLEQADRERKSVV